LQRLTTAASHERDVNLRNGNGHLPVRRIRRFTRRMAAQHSSVDHLADVRSRPTTDEKEIMLMSTARNTIAAWDFARWFAVLSPLIGILLGFLGAYFLLH
jgi:hypothetical protein